METVALKRSSRILGGHPWIFSNELSISPKRFAPGSLVRAVDRQGGFLGIGYINPHSLISIRLLTSRDEPIDEGFFRARMLSAVEYRKKACGEKRLKDSLRLIFSEGDYLPGLIVDKYGDCLAVQFLTLGMEGFREIILRLLDELFNPKTMVLRNDGSSRALEGLGLEKTVIKGDLTELPRITEGGAVFEVNPLLGQKTGFFLDQSENRLAMKDLVKGGTGLDIFSYTGAWGIQAALNSAKITGIDSSADAINQAIKNAGINGVSDRCSYVKADAFAFLRENAAGNTYDFIILDPPAFAKSRARLKEALRAYRDINALSMRLVKKGGILATSSCSHHVSREAFTDALNMAARDAGKRLRVIEARSQAKDHPALLAVAETEYLKCFLLEVS
ncbi:MAG: class I SAM-dependent rRNA methyltransferase [Deltaproteobacteria bacterium]